MIEASTNAPIFDKLFFSVVVVCSVVFMGVMSTLFYFSWKYRSTNSVDRNSPPVSNTKLEFGWTLPTLFVFFIFFIYGAKIYSDSRSINSIDDEVFVMAKQWVWKFQHKDGRREVNVLHIPVGKKIKLTMISEDVVHSLFIPDFRIKQDLLPERYTTLVFQATRPGMYPVLCTQYCGVDHSKMLANVIVMNEGDFKVWNDLYETSIGTLDVEKNLILEGKHLFYNKGCIACHLDKPEASGQTVMAGPRLWNLYGHAVSIQDGSEVTADDNYIRESVFDPNAKIVKGFQPLMPTFEGLLTENDFQKILAYIKSLKQGSSPK